METLANLGDGFLVAFSPTGLAFTFIGVLLGQLIGALPGIGPSAGMALLLPVTFGMDPTIAVMMLAGILYGGQYGGTLTSVLINVPGEAASVMTAIDGHQLAKQGRAGAALSVAAVGSFIAGVAANLAVAFAAPALSDFAFRFSSPEFFLLALLGLTASASLGSGSTIKSLLVAAAGLVVAFIGTDPMTGVQRLTFGSSDLLDGIDFLPVAIGIFGIAEVISSLERAVFAAPIVTRLREMWPTAEEWADSRIAIVRGGLVGFFIGIMPGAGPALAALLAYITERRFSRHPERFGHGAIDGVAASESANNAAAQGALIPMLALGIPGSASTAVLLAALVLQGITPGPMLMTQQPRLVWGLIASMFVGNMMLLILNLPLAPLFAWILRIPYMYLAPPILILSLVGAYATTLNMFTVWVTVGFGLLGYLMMKANLPRAPMVLAIVLAPLLESSLRQSLMFSQGSPSIFFERPISLVLVIVVTASLFMPVLFSLRRRFRSATAPVNVSSEDAS